MFRAAKLLQFWLTARKDNCKLIFPQLKSKGYPDGAVKAMSCQQITIAENENWSTESIPSYPQHAHRRYFITMFYIIWYNNVIIPDLLFLFQPNLSDTLTEFKHSIKEMFNTKEYATYVAVDLFDRSSEDLYHPYTHYFFDVRNIVRLQEEQLRSIFLK